jgi:hypothetical protein
MSSELFIVGKGMGRKMIVAKFATIDGNRIMEGIANEEKTSDTLDATCNIDVHRACGMWQR